MLKNVLRILMICPLWSHVRPAAVRESPRRHTGTELVATDNLDFAGTLDSTVTFVEEHP